MYVGTLHDTQSVKYDAELIEPSSDCMDDKPGNILNCSLLGY